MKTILVVATLLLTSSAIANSNFDKRKSMMIDHIQKRIGALNENKTCLTNATKKEDLKACHKTMREKMKPIFHQLCRLWNPAPNRIGAGPEE